MQTAVLLQNWRQTDFFVRGALSQLNDANADFRLLPNTSSVGFLLQHMAESGVLLLNAFFNANVEFSRATVQGAVDEGQAANPDQIRAFWDEFDGHMQNVLEREGATPVDATRETFLGPKTVSECFAIIAYHTNYHLGQAQLTLKKGSVLHGLPVLEG